MEHTRDAYSVRDNFFIQFCVLLTDLDAGSYKFVVTTPLPWAFEP